MTRRGCVQRLADRLPEPLLANPERVALNVAAVVIGLAAMIPPPGSSLDRMADWLATAVGALFIAGGCLSLHASWTGTRYTERVGALAYALACIIYVAQLLYQNGSSATAPAVIFGGVAVAKLLRWVRSVAYEKYARQRRDDG